MTSSEFFPVTTCFYFPLELGLRYQRFDVATVWISSKRYSKHIEFIMMTSS
jgi:hypothetical protein